jgi:hypothetical protein
MKQCDKCTGYLFFKPLPDETFSCCGAWKESVEDIDLKSGVSPKIQTHRIDGVPCRRFKKGKSICETSKEQPFKLHPVREAGEKFLERALQL